MNGDAGTNTTNLITIQRPSQFQTDWPILWLSKWKAEMGIKRYNPEEIVTNLRHVDVPDGQGIVCTDAIRQISVTEQTCY